MSAKTLFVDLQGRQGEQVLYVRKILDVLRNASADQVEEIAEAIASHENLTCILIDAPLYDYLSESIITAIISNRRITRLSVFNITEANMPLIRRLLHEMTSLRRVVLPNPIPTSNEDEIFSALHTVTMLKELHVVFSRDDNESFEGSAKALIRYIRDSSSLTTLGFSFWTWTISLRSLFSCICEAIGECSSLRCLMMNQRFRSFDETVDLVGMAELLAPAIQKSLLLEEVRFLGSNTVLMDQICSTLESTVAVRNFDLTFCQVNNELLKLSRKWKKLLGDNLPLNNWPEILREADDWVEKSQSHYSTDVHYFLVREMCPLLLHNLPQNDEMIAGRLELTSGADLNVHGVCSKCCGVM